MVVRPHFKTYSRKATFAAYSVSGLATTTGRPRSSLGPGIPERFQAEAPAGVHRHRLPDGYRVVKKPILGGLHHEYGLKEAA